MVRSTAAPSSVAEIAERIPQAPGRNGPSREAIAEVVALIAELFGPERIVLFGSRAYGEPAEESDVDLMVVMDTPLSTTQQAWQIYDAIPRRVDLRIHPTVRSPEEIQRGLQEGDFFILDAIERGVTLYEAVARREGQGGAMTIVGGEEAGDRPGLKRSTLDMLRKCEEDCGSVTYLLNAPVPYIDLACYHAPQCVEKLLKAFLQQHDTRYPRTHEVVELMRKVAPRLPDSVALEADLEWLNRFIDVRYPGIDAARSDAERALGISTDVRRLRRGALDLDDG